MRLIGLTGGIAVGKTLVTRLLSARGAVTFSADEAARAVLAPGGPALRRIGKEFGRDALAPSGELDRARMARIVFADPAALRRLEGILHPLIRSLLLAQIEAVRRDLPAAIVVVEIPLLYEGGLETWFDEVIVVTAPEALQRERLMRRSGLGSAEITARLSAQWPLEAKATLADIVVVNSGSPAELGAAVEILWQNICTGRNAGGRSRK